GFILPEHLPTASPALLDAHLSPVESAADRLRATVKAWANQRLSGGVASSALYEAFLEFVEPPFLEAVMKKYQGQCSAAARALGIHRTTLKKKLEQYGIAGDE